MADIVCLHAKDEVERFCRRNPTLHVYALGDLDDFFWPHTTWYALREDGQARQLVLLYGSLVLPNLMAYAEPPVTGMRDLLRGMLPMLPRRFYAHFSLGTKDVLAEDYRIHSHGLFYKMALTQRSRLEAIDTGAATALADADTSDLLALYAAGYPRNWFAPRMLQTGFYYGVRRAGMLASVAGVHVVSPLHKVAALGNITTHPEFRGQGLATTATARLCQELLRAGIEHIGLNVRADNTGAVACYKKLGFEPIAEYEECDVTT